MTEPRVLVTGANGFIGTSLCAQLATNGTSYIAQQRRPISIHEHDFLADLANLETAKGQNQWHGALMGVNTVYHLAGLAHRDRADAGTEMDRTNHLATQRLATLAAQCGVRRFVLLSSVIAMGDNSGSSAFTPETKPAPSDAYGQSKLAAERSLQAICAQSSMSACIVRAPLVIGAGAKGNLPRLVHWINQGRPVPVAKPPSQRSMIALPNLIDLLLSIAVEPAAADRTLLPSDRHWSTPELVRQICTELGRPTRLLPIPASWLELAGRLSRRRHLTRRLTESLLVSDPTLSDILGFTPAHDPNNSIAAMVAQFKAGRPSHAS